MLTQSDMSGHRRTVAVFGASGHTGRFMVAQLLRRGFAPLAIGRDISKLTESGFQESNVPIRTAFIDDPASLDRSLAGAALGDGLSDRAGNRREGAVGAFSDAAAA